jgi:AbrB family looped-hinge helix DNA binding protein
MEVTIDKFGRVVLPKPLRDELDLEAGSVLVVEEVDEGILLKPVRDEPNLVDMGGVLVFVGNPTDDLTDAVNTLRGKRLRALASWKPPRR